MSTLKLFLLGAPRVEHGKPLKLPRQKSLALLIYLATTAREQPREKLATLFWPDASEAQSRQALRTALSDIRRATGGDHLAADTETASFNVSANVWMDTRELETLAQEPLHEPPRGLRFAPFLEGFNLKDAPDFDDWASFERDRLQQLAIKALRARADAYEARGELAQAIAAAQQLLGLDNVNEETHRQLMRLRYAAGDRAAALKQYDTARALLGRELGVEPMEETRALYQQIVNQAKNLIPAPPKREIPRRAPRPEPTELSLPFVGRETERAELQSRWQIANDGRAQFVFVEGEAGVGKTRLIEEQLSAWEPQALTLRGTAHQSESNQPYHPIIDILREYFRTNLTGLEDLSGLSDIWLGEISRLVPELRAAHPNLPPALRLAAAQERSGLIEATQERNRLFEAIGQFLRSLTARQPVALFLDDAQWTDPSTLALLAYLATSLSRARLLVLCAYRGAEANADLEHLMQTLSRAGILTRLTLNRLDQHQVVELTEQMSHRDCAPFAEWLYRESEGNPFFIRELIAYLIANGLAKTDGRGAQIDPDQLAQSLPAMALPSSIHDLIRARLQRVGELARQLIDVAAIIGREFDFATLWRASGKAEDDALNALDELLRAQLVRQTAAPLNPYEFTHTKIREAVLNDMSLARQQILHRRVGEALEVTQRERLPELSGALATHFQLAGDWAGAARYARMAGDRARAVLAPQEAIEFYTDALEALSHLDDREATARVHLGLGEAYVALGRLDRSYESYAHALAIWELLGDHERVAAARLALGSAHIFRAEYRQVYELAQAALRDLEDVDHPDRRIVARAHVLWAAALSSSGNALADAKVHLQRASQLYEQTDDYTGQCQAQLELGNIAAQEGALPQAVAHYERGLEIAARGKEIMFEALMCNNAAYHSLLLGDTVKAHQFAQRGLAIAEAHSIAPVLTYLYSTAAEILLSERKWDEAETLLNKGMALAEQLNSPERRAGYLANLAEVAYGRGEHESAIEKLTAAAQIADEIGARYASARYHIRLAEMFAERGKTLEAQSHLQRGKQIALEGSFRRLLEQAEEIKRKA